MPIFEKSFNDEFFWKYVWRKVYNFLIWKNITVSSISEKLWKSQPDISNLLNWKRTTKNLDQYRDIAICGWMTDSEFQKIVKEAKKAEYEQTTWDFIPDGKVNTLEDIDFDNEELLKVMFKKDWLKEPTEDDIKEIMNFIKFKAKK